jgi:predicted XRE-type DNA-binding protein
MTQAKAAEILGIDQPKVSALVRGKLSGFSLERIIHFLNLLGRDVQIVVKAKPRSRSLGGLKVLCV